MEITVHKKAFVVGSLHMKILLGRGAVVVECAIVYKQLKLTRLCHIQVYFV